MGVGGSQSRHRKSGNSIRHALGAMASTTLSHTGVFAFDVCHVGVVLRAVFFVHAVLAVAMLFCANGPMAWLHQLAWSSSVALPGLLLWLVLCCGCKVVLARLRPFAQWGAALLLGGIGAAFGHGLMRWTWGNFTFDQPFRSDDAGPTIVAGMAFAAVIFYGLSLRARLRFPADTRARLVELQSRIRPHFLFNTLNTAIALVRSDPARAEGVLEDLAELFRGALAETNPSVSLADEVLLAKRYLAIEQIRFGTRLRLQWQLDERAGAARVPALLLQPLVENAVRHGIELAPEGGEVCIMSRVSRGQAEISIRNTVPEQASQAGHGIALANVRERLLLLHDVAAQFEVRRGRTWFSVRMVVPL
jgi:two-component system, LytTR family, sensor histidine kinase AlgZ